MLQTVATWLASGRLLLLLLLHRFLSSVDLLVLVLILMLPLSLFLGILNGLFLVG